MDEKTLKITPPDGYEIDKKRSTFDNIVFKPIDKNWRNRKERIEGYFINEYGRIQRIGTSFREDSTSVFHIQKQAKSAIAMAHISQILANDTRFGGAITDEEWDLGNEKFVILRIHNEISMEKHKVTYHFLAFHTPEQRNLFFKENEDLVKDYLMI